MALGLLEGLGIASTIANFLQGKSAQAAAERAMKPQRLLDMQRYKALKSLLDLASEYDPERQGEIAADYARERTAETLKQALAKLASVYTQAGGVPGLSTAYQANLQKTVDNVLGPLAATLAELKAGAPEKKMQAYALAAGSGPGQLGSSPFAQLYLQQAGGYGQAAAASLMQLAQMLAPKQQTGQTTGGGQQKPSNESKWSIPVTLY